MKKLNIRLLVLLVIVCSILPVKAQFLGIRSSNFGGITNVNYNPAIADARYKVDINLFTVDWTASNSYLGKANKPFNFKNFDDETDLAEKLNGKKKFGYMSMTMQLPSFLVAFGKNRSNNQAIGFSTHVNSVTNVDNLEEALARNIRWGWGQNAFNHIGNFVTPDFRDASGISVKSMVWADMGVTYSRVVLDKDKHFLKVGGTLKIIKGLAAMYAYSDNFKYRFDALDTINIQDTRIHAGATQNLDYFYSDNGEFTASTFFQKDVFSNRISKWSAAGDIGLVYEFRKNKESYKYSMDCQDLYYNDRDKHFLQVGFSVVNIGRINYTKYRQVNDYYIQNLRSGDPFDQNTLLNDWKAESGNVVDSSSTSFKMWLPTTINVWADVNIIKGFGVNVAAQINPIPMKKQNVHQLSIVSVTPHYDMKWFGAYMPVAVDQFGNVQWGIGLRAGPLYIGSQDFFSYLMKKSRRDFNIQAGLKISIPNRTAKDKDKDGISNKKDLCPEQKGVCPDGCPDRDGDGILDAEDKCPDTPGKKELQGCPDRDDDGIIDMEDECPDQAGLLQFKGCPDRDSDKVADKDDKCPDTPGKVELQGCPDRDNDGVTDAEDKCPDVAGDKAHDGCPDTDGDGLYDNEDKCPTVKGPRENAGCPYPDTDGDGVLDKDDACPTVKGPKENKGCPVIEEKVKKVLLKARSIQFETGKAVIKPVSYAILNEVAKILKDYPYYNVNIEGHTDDVGKEDFNLKLSQDRAKSALDYLTKQGVDQSRMTSSGFGESKPIATNKTAAGRSQNRRVEFNLVIK
jgi:outer membrane protein OmpA-like peptidoglycan-associated protein